MRGSLPSIACFFFLLNICSSFFDAVKVFVRIIDRWAGVRYRKDTSTILSVLECGGRGWFYVYAIHTIRVPPC